MTPVEKESTSITSLHFLYYNNVTDYVRVPTASSNLVYISLVSGKKLAVYTLTLRLFVIRPRHAQSQRYKYQITPRTAL